MVARLQLFGIDPYISSIKKSPFILSFTLGNANALRSVLSITCLLAIGIVVDLVQGELKCSELNREFNLQLKAPGKG